MKTATESRVIRPVLAGLSPRAPYRCCLGSLVHRKSQGEARPALAAPVADPATRQLGLVAGQSYLSSSKQLLLKRKEQRFSLQQAIYRITAFNLKMLPERPHQKAASALPYRFNDPAGVYHWLVGRGGNCDVSGIFCQLASS